MAIPPLDPLVVGGHIPHATLIEAGSLPMAELNLPHDRPIATHRGHGQRAATALSVLHWRGFEKLALVAEGADAWGADGGAIEGAFVKSASDCAPTSTNSHC